MTGSAFAIMHITKDRVEIEETLFINNKKNAKMGIGYRLGQIETGLNKLLKGHDGQIQAIVREKGFSRFPAITQALFRVVGVSDLVIYKNGCDQLPFAEISPTSVKKLVTGNGKASKEEVEEAVRTFLIEPQKDYFFETDDVSDAVAVGIAYGLQKKILKV